MQLKSQATAILGLLLVLSAVAFAQDAVQVAQDHLAVAKSYEEKATVYERLSAEHEAMLKERHKSYEDSRSWDSLNRGSSRGRGYSNDFLSPLMLAQKHRHCETIAKSAKALQARLLKFAEFHKQQAVEIEKATKANEGAQAQ